MATVAALAASLRGSRVDDSLVVLGVLSGAGGQGALKRVRERIVQLRDAVASARMPLEERSTNGRARSRGSRRTLFSMLRPDEHRLSRASSTRRVDTPVSRFGITASRWIPGARDRVHTEMVSHGVWSAGADRRVITTF